MRGAGLFWKGGGGQEVKGVRDLKRGPLKVRKGLGRGTGLEVLPLSEPHFVHQEYGKGLDLDLELRLKTI